MLYGGTLADIAAGQLPGWGDFCSADAGYRCIMGKADVGRMVGLGCRLTSMLILFFFYLGFIALANGFDRAERGSRLAALLALWYDQCSNCQVLG